MCVVGGDWGDCDSLTVTPPAAVAPDATRGDGAGHGLWVMEIGEKRVIQNIIPGSS